MRAMTGTSGRADDLGLLSTTLSAVAGFRRRHACALFLASLRSYRAGWPPLLQSDQSVSDLLERDRDPVEVEISLAFFHMLYFNLNQKLVAFATSTALSFLSFKLLG